MVTVKLTRLNEHTEQTLYDGKKTFVYKPVNRHSARMIASVNGGCQWFYAHQWDTIKTTLKENGEKLTKSHYHVSTKTEQDYT